MTDPIDPEIADAILHARILRLQTAREAFEHFIGRPATEEEWLRVEGTWTFHAGRTDGDLLTLSRAFRIDKRNR